MRVLAERAALACCGTDAGDGNSTRPVCKNAPHFALPSIPVPIAGALACSGPADFNVSGQLAVGCWLDKEDVRPPARFP